MVEADLDDVPISFLGSKIRVSGYPRAELRTVLEEAGLIVEDERVVTYDPLGARPEVQIFLTFRRGACGHLKRGLFYVRSRRGSRPRSAATGLAASCLDNTPPSFTT